MSVGYMKFPTAGGYFYNRVDKGVQKYVSAYAKIGHLPIRVNRN